MTGIVSTIQTAFLKYGLNIAAATLIFFIGRWLAQVVTNLVGRILLKSNIDKTLSSFLRDVLYWILFIFVCIAALNKLGVETTSLIALLGAAGLTVGLALQGSLANFAAGIMIIMFRPFKVGDLISAGGTTGTVEEIQIFNTILNAPDNRREIIPNSKITGDNITNYSAIEKRRIDLKFSISYKDDMKKAKDVLVSLLQSDQRILKDPAPFVAVSELGECSVNLVCRPWVKPDDYWAVYYDLVENGKLALEQSGATIPCPQRDIHPYEHKR